MVNLTGEYFEVTARPSDRWDLLAFDYLGDASLQSLVIQANFETYVDDLAMPPLIIPAGTKIRIPVVEAGSIDEADLPPWKRSDPDYEATE
jgi:hypothetical protein